MFDEDGSSLPVTDEPNEQLITETMDGAINEKLDLDKEKLWTKQLLEICPGARSIIFFPLWDPSEISSLLGLWHGQVILRGSC